jgi:hypothetical protein
MSGLSKQSSSGQHVNADFGTLMANPLKYKGKLVKSEALLVHAHERAVRVQGESGEAKTLIPYSQKVGTKAVSIMNDRGRNSRVFVTYGVVNADNITLFGIGTQ